MIITSNITEELGFKVIKEKNAKQAIEIFEESMNSEIDGILLDIEMTIMNGIEAIKHIRKNFGSYGANIPIIAMSESTFD